MTDLEKSKMKVINQLITYQCETTTEWNILNLLELSVDELAEMLEYYKQIND